MIVAGLFVVGAWHLDQLDVIKTRSELHVAMAPPAESAGSPAQPRTTRFERKKKDKPKVVVQPSEHPPVAEVATATTTTTGIGDGSGEGSGAGSGAGSGSGSSESPCTADCGPPAHEHPEPAPQQQIIPPQLLSGLRVSGETQLQPPDMVKTDMHRAGTSRVVASFQVCLDTHGSVASTRQLKPSGYPGYDAELVRGLSTWRYKPYTLNGRGIAVCSVVTFIYSMK